MHFSPKPNPKTPRANKPREENGAFFPAPADGALPDTELCAVVAILCAVFGEMARETYRRKIVAVRAEYRGLPAGWSVALAPIMGESPGWCDF